MRKLFLLIGVLFITWACKPKNGEQIITDEGNNSIQLSSEQIKVSGIKTGKIEKKAISEMLECSGQIQVSPTNKAIASPGLNGFIKDVFVKEGDFVKAGSVLVSVTHPGFIILQQQYLESKSRVDFYEKEFKRQGELTVENAASIKNMEKAQSDYWTAQAAYKSAKTQLEILGINTEKLEKENFVKAFNVVAPISGFVSNLSINKGQFLESTDIVCEIININTLQIVLNIFEKDLQQIKIGQLVTFNSVHNKNQPFTTKVQIIGAQTNMENRTIKVMCNFENKDAAFHPGMFIRASVGLNEHESYCLPQTAIISQNGKSVIFIKKGEAFFERIINTGITQDGVVEIIEPDNEILTSEIVVEGTYFLFADTD